ncbi:hypothetical protein NDA14_005296 [Ustilago hordei]|nr:hypothetical protein NDA14_005296 [Ustilago hordei]
MATQPDFDACASWQEIAAKPSRYSIPAIFDQIQRPRLDRMDSKGQRKPSTTIKRQASSKLGSILDGYDATAIVELTRSGKLSVQQVTQHFLNRASIVHQATNCLSHFFAEEALQRAKQLDHKRSRFEKQGRLNQLGQLFGLPMSIKGHLSYNRHGNAVIIGKTTMPQGVMHLDTRSNLYGQTLNPHNLALSPGGSSGGESAMVAGGGSALGVGSDIGGSIRQPCGVTGLYGLRPTTQRLPYAGVRSTMPGNEAVTSSLGADGHFFAGFESLLNSKPGKPLIVGVMMQDNVVRPTTPIRRALSHWVDKLQQSTSANRARIELRRWDPLDMHRRAWHLIRSLYFIDSGKLFHLVAKSTGEPLLPLTQYILSQPFVPSATANLEADSSNNTASPKLEEMSVTQLWAAVRAREAFPKEFFKRWNELQLDCLLSPVQGNVAPRPGTIKYWGYTSVFNLVDYPGLVFPSGFKADARRDEEYEEKERSLQAEFGHTSKKQGEWLSDFDKDNMQEYQQHRAVFDNAPVGLQLIGGRYKDEELIKYAELLQHLVSTHKYISQGSCPILASFLLPIALSSTSSLQT